MATKNMNLTGKPKQKLGREFYKMPKTKTFQGNKATTPKFTTMSKWEERKTIFLSLPNSPRVEGVGASGRLGDWEEQPVGWQSTYMQHEINELAAGDYSSVNAQQCPLKNVKSSIPQLESTQLRSA